MIGTSIVAGILAILYVGIIFYIRRSPLRDRSGTILVSIALLFLSILFFYMTFSFPIEEGVGPATVPRLWISFLMILNVYLIYRAVKGIEGPDQEEGDPKKTLKFVILMILYIGLLDILGYFIDTFLFLVISPLMLYYKKIVNLILISVIWLVFVYYVFMRTLHIPIPLGIFSK